MKRLRFVFAFAYCSIASAYHAYYSYQNYLRPQYEHSTKYDWIVGNWEQCTATCGGGKQLRRVFCAEKYLTHHNTTETKRVPERYCWQNKRPDDVRPCNKQHCPYWEAGEWSQCSATCDKGIQHRNVTCRHARFVPLTEANACNPLDKPSTTQVCYTDVNCAKVQDTLADQLVRFAHQPSYEYADPSSHVLTTPDGSSPHWVPGQWGTCSTTCGLGIRRRPVDCYANNFMRMTMERLSPHECNSRQKPSETEPCELRRCPQRYPAPITTQAPQMHQYLWQHGDWSECSASCLGGTQQTVLICVDKTAGMKEVAWSYCNPAQRPVMQQRSCNTQPCPPKWEAGRWSVCSTSCGGGQRTRKVQCVRQISKEGDATTRTLVLPDSDCLSQKQDRPIDRETCNAVDCPAQWITHAWSRCSRSCGAGEQQRLVYCSQRMANGEEVREESACAQEDKPVAVQLCDLGACNPNAQHRQPTPPIVVKPSQGSTSTNTQRQRPRVPPLPPKALTIKLQDNKHRNPALFEGQSVKVKCPGGKGIDRSLMVWTKNGQRINDNPNGRIKISNRGALRVFHAKAADNGVYECWITGKRLGSIVLNFGRLPFHGYGPKGYYRSTAEPLFQPAPTDATADDGDDDDEIEEKNSSASYNAAASSVDSSASGESTVEVVKNIDQKLVNSIRDYIYAKRLNSALYNALGREDATAILKVYYRVGAWSPCPAVKCSPRSERLYRSDDMQIRQVACTASALGYEAQIDDRFCEENDLEKPPTAQLCTGAETQCPDWKTGPWSACTACVSWKKALQRRTVTCEYKNGTTAPRHECDRRTRPRAKNTCIAVWATGRWGACTHTCGDYGVQYRVLTCVWHGTNNPAGTFCQTAQKPAISRPCVEQPPCPTGGAYVGNALLWHAHNKNLQHWRGLSHLNNIYRQHAGYSNHHKPGNYYA